MSSARVVAVAAALAGGMGLGVLGAVSQGTQGVSPWTTTHAAGTAAADGTAPRFTDISVTEAIDAASRHPFVL